jgi:hypothetical protein
MPSKTDPFDSLTPCLKAIGAMLHQCLTAPQPPNLLETLQPPSTLTQLRHTFSLATFEQHLLLLCAAAALDPEVAQLCATLNGNPQYPHPTPHIARTLFPSFNWYAFTPQAPLQHWHLLETKPALAFALNPLQIDPAILFYLMGESFCDPALLELFEPVSPVAPSLSSSHQAIAQQLADQWQQFNPSVPPVQLWGNDRATHAAIALTACELVGGVKLSRISLTHLTTHLRHSPHPLTALIRRWTRTAHLTHQILLMDCDSSDPASIPVLAQLIEQCQTPLILSSPVKQPAQRRSLLSFEVPPLTPQEQITLWQECLGETIDPQIPQIVSQFNLSANAIQTIAAQALTQPSHPNTLWNLCRQHARPRLDDLAQRIDTHATWDDLILPDLEATQIKTLVAHIRQRFTVYQSWGFATKSQRGLGISALFQGKSGTGKTTAAEIIAKALHLDLYRIDLSQVVSKYIGETEKNLRSVFDAAEAGGVVLLFDEADALFGKRSDVKDSHDRYANMEVSYLLQKMEAYQGLAILTTNLRETIDSAFVRRIRFIVKFSLPDYAQRKAIWERMFPVQMPQQEIHLGRLARLNVTGGSIKNIALNAAFLAAEAGEAVQMKHCLVATRSEYGKLERLLTDTEIEDWV